MPRFAVVMLLPAGMVGTASTGIYPHHATTVGTGVGTIRPIASNALKNKGKMAEGMSANFKSMNIHPNPRHTGKYLSI